MIITNLFQFKLKKRSNTDRWVRIINNIEINILHKKVLIKCDRCQKVFKGLLQCYFDKEKQLCKSCQNHYINLGRNVSEEAKIKIGNANRGMRRSAETRKKISEAGKGKHRKPIYEIWVEKYGKKEADKRKRIANEKRKKSCTKKELIKKFGHERCQKNFNKKSETMYHISKNRKKEKTNVSIEYWLNKGYSYKEAKKKLKERQATFTLEKCIEKYGSRKGKKIWQERQTKWLNTLNLKSDKEKGIILKKKLCNFIAYSKISQELFWKIYQKIKNDYKKIYFAELGKSKNNEYFIRTEKKEIKFLDFYIKDINKCIEFDGNYWHSIPKIIKQDKKREKDILKVNPTLKILHIKEKDYINNKETILNKCIKFLKGEQ